VVATGSAIEHRTKANNQTFSAKTVDEQRASYEAIIESQIKAWRSLLPPLIKKFSEIKDPRNPLKIKHKMVVLMVFGLLMFIFRLSSRRNANKQLSQPLLLETLREIIPELESIPHADTLTRLLERIQPEKIERMHIDMIRSLIKNKKFKKLLIQGYLPISIDGTQKLYRDGILHDERWLERKRRDGEDWKMQQYVYVVEANITLANGLTIPLLTEYLFLSEEQIENEEMAQDCELEGATRLMKKLKEYFPKLKLIILLDNLYANQTTLQFLKENKFQFMVKLPKKLKAVKEILDKAKSTRGSIPQQPYYRGRKQEFYWLNNIDYQGIDIHAVSCLEHWREVNKETGEIEDKYSEHAWISSLKLSIKNAHELCNLCARQRAGIEDSINTEKNRGYQYKHAFSYDWNAMRGFHYLMRLGHAINALSEFTKKLKRYIKELGLSATLKMIYTALSNPWLTKDWLAKQLTEVPQLRLQLE